MTIHRKLVIKLSLSRIRITIQSVWPFRFQWLTRRCRGGVCVLAHLILFLHFYKVSHDLNTFTIIMFSLELTLLIFECVVCYVEPYCQRKLREGLWMATSERCGCNLVMNVLLLLLLPMVRRHLTDAAHHCLCLWHDSSEGATCYVRLCYVLLLSLVWRLYSIETGSSPSKEARVSKSPVTL